LKEAENPREKKRLENLIKVTDKELLKLRNRTTQVLKNTNRMQRQLDSIK
jgi:phage shock protein A